MKTTKKFKNIINYGFKLNDSNDNKFKSHQKEQQLFINKIDLLKIYFFILLIL